MTTLTTLTATPVDAPPQHIAQEHVVLDEHHIAGNPGSVWWRELRVGIHQITLKAGAAAVAIPVAELWKLAEAHDPRLIPPPTS